MTKKSTYATYAASYSGTELILYCFDKSLIDIDEFVLFETIAQTKAIQKQYGLFNVYETTTAGYTIVGLN